MDFEKRVQRVLAKNHVSSEVEDLISDLAEALEDTRELAQHLLDCARGNDIVSQTLPDWLEDEEEDEDEDEEEYELEDEE